MAKVNARGRTITYEVSREFPTADAPAGTVRHTKRLMSDGVVLRRITMSYSHRPKAYDSGWKVDKTQNDMPPVAWLEFHLGRKWQQAET